MGAMLVISARATRIEKLFQISNSVMAVLKPHLILHEQSIGSWPSERVPDKSSQKFLMTS